MGRVNLNENIDAIIEHPLRDLNRTELTQDVKQFANDKHLEESSDQLMRGALLAKDPHLYEQVARGKVDGATLPLQLSRREKDAITWEKDRLFKQSRDLYIMLVTCSAAAVVQGWDQTGTNSANLFWPPEFGIYKDRSPDDWLIGNSNTAVVTYPHSLTAGLVNAAPYLSSALIGCVLAEPINTLFGRRGTIFFAGLWCFASVIGSAFTHSWQALFASRICLGVGMGCKASTVAVFSAECAPTYFRGSIAMSWQLWVAIGIFLGFTASLIVFRAGDWAWRLMVGSACIPAIPLLILVYISPESPRWYMKRGSPSDYDKALRAMLRLRNTALQAHRDFYLMHKQLQYERVYFRPLGADLEHAALRPAMHRLGTYFVRVSELFSVPRIRRASLAAGTVMLAQQLCGINVLAFYSNTLFSRAQGQGQGDVLISFLYSWGFGLINAVFALPAVKTIDILGRRPLLLISFFLMFWTLLAAGLCFFIPDGQYFRTGVIALFLFLFAAAYSPGEGPVPFTYSAEVFPLSHRELGMGFAVAVNLFFAGLLTVVFPHLDNAIHDTGALGLFAGFNVIGFVLIFLWVPETANRTLEELSQVFAVPTRRHMHYQVTTYAPWVFQRFVLRRPVELRPLYQEDAKSGWMPTMAHAPIIDDPGTRTNLRNTSVDARHRMNRDGDDISRASSIHD